MADWHLEELAPGVFARTGASHPLQPNSGIIAGDGSVVVIDSGYSTAAGRALLADVRRVTALPVKAVLLSHHHFDHAWGSEAFAGAAVIGHENARRAMLTDTAAYREAMAQFAPTSGGWYGLSGDELRTEFAATTIRPPSLTYGSRMTLHLGGQRIELYHLGPGHTAGDTLVYLPEAKILFGGDLVCNHVLPNAADADPLNWMRIVAAVEEIDFEYLVPGHGPVGGRPAVCDFDACLATLLREVRRALEEGAPDPRAASERLRLGEFAEWAGAELLPGSVRRVYRALEAAGAGR